MPPGGDHLRQGRRQRAAGAGDRLHHETAVLRELRGHLEVGDDVRIGARIGGGAVAPLHEIVSRRRLRLDRRSARSGDHLLRHFGLAVDLAVRAGDVCQRIGRRARREARLDRAARRDRRRRVDGPLQTAAAVATDGGDGEARIGQDLELQHLPRARDLLDAGYDAAARAGRRRHDQAAGGDELRRDVHVGDDARIGARILRRAVAPLQELMARIGLGQDRAAACAGLHLLHQLTFQRTVRAGRIGQPVARIAAGEMRLHVAARLDRRSRVQLALQRAAATGHLDDAEQRIGRDRELQHRTGRDDLHQIRGDRAAGAGGRSHRELAFRGELRHHVDVGHDVLVLARIVGGAVAPLHEEVPRMGDRRDRGSRASGDHRLREGAVDHAAAARRVAQLVLRVAGDERSVHLAIGADRRGRIDVALQRAAVAAADLVDRVAGFRKHLELRRTARGDLLRTERREHAAVVVGRNDRVNRGIDRRALRSRFEMIEYVHVLALSRGDAVAPLHEDVPRLGRGHDRRAVVAGGDLLGEHAVDRAGDLALRTCLVGQAVQSAAGDEVDGERTVLRDHAGVVGVADEDALATADAGHAETRIGQYRECAVAAVRDLHPIRRSDLAAALRGDAEDLVLGNHELCGDAQPCRDADVLARIFDYAVAPAIERVTRVGNRPDRGAASAVRNDLRNLLDVTLQRTVLTGVVVERHVSREQRVHRAVRDDRRGREHLADERSAAVAGHALDRMTGLGRDRELHVRAVRDRLRHRGRQAAVRPRLGRHHEAGGVAVIQAHHREIRLRLRRGRRGPGQQDALALRRNAVGKIGAGRNVDVGRSLLPQHVRAEGAVAGAIGAQAQREHLGNAGISRLLRRTGQDDLAVVEQYQIVGSLVAAADHEHARVVDLLSAAGERAFERAVLFDHHDRGGVRRGPGLHVPGHVRRAERIHAHRGGAVDLVPAEVESDVLVAAGEIGVQNAVAHLELRDDEIGIAEDDVFADRHELVARRHRDIAEHAVGVGEGQPEAASAQAVVEAPIRTQSRQQRARLAADQRPSGQDDSTVGLDRQCIGGRVLGDFREHASGRGTDAAEAGIDAAVEIEAAHEHAGLLLGRVISTSGHDELSIGLESRVENVASFQQRIAVAHAATDAECLVDDTVGRQTRDADLVLELRGNRDRSDEKQTAVRRFGQRGRVVVLVSARHVEAEGANAGAAERRIERAGRFDRRRQPRYRQGE
jgi:hypothetical protein